MKILLIILLITCLNNLISQSIDDYFLETDGVVNDIDSDSNYVYFAGEFTHVMEFSGSGVIFSKDKIEVDFNNKYKITGEVYTSKPDGNGGWYVGGNFIKIGEYQVSNLVHFFSDGSLDTNFIPYFYNGIEVRFFVIEDEFIYIPFGNEVYIVNKNTGDSKVLKLDINSRDESFYIKEIQIYGDYIFANGTKWWRGEDSGYLGIFSKETGELIDNIFLISDTPILRKYENHLYALGSNNTLIQYNIESKEFKNLNVKVSNLIDIKFDNNNIFISGSSIYKNNNNIGNLVRIDLDDNNDGTNWKSYNVEENCFFDIDEKFIYISGMETHDILKIDKNSGNFIENFGFDAILSGNSGFSTYPVKTISSSGNNLFLGGLYSPISKVIKANNFFRYDVKENRIDTTFKITLDAPYNFVQFLKIKLVDKFLYISGRYTKIDGIDFNGLAKYNLEESKVADTWKPKLLEDGYISSLENDDTYLYVGGEFELENQFKNLVRYSLLNDELDLNWSPNPNRYVSALKVEGNSLYVGGKFDTIYHTEIPYLSKIDTKNNNLIEEFDLGFVYDPNYKSKNDLKYGVRLIESNESDIFINGILKNKDNVEINGFAKISKSDLQIKYLNDTINNLSVDGIAVQDNYLYSGRFKVDLEKFKINENWHPNLYASRLCIEIKDNYIYYSGFYYSYIYYRNYLMRFKIEDNEIEAPDLIFPANNSVNVPLLIKLECSKIKNINNYEFVFSYDSTFKEENKKHDYISYRNFIKFGTGILKPSAKVYWKARAINHIVKSDWSEVFSFETRFKGPKFIYSDEDVITYSDIEYSPFNIKWEDFGENFVYFLTASEDENFENIVIDSLLINKNLYSINNFKDSSTYYIRVYALENDRISEKSTTLMINTLYKKIPDKINLVYPINESVELSLNYFALSWFNTRDCEVNVLQVSTDSLFNSLIINDDSIKVEPNIYDKEKKSYSLKNLDSNTTYYWRVKAKNKLGESEFSDTWKFTTVSSTSNVEYNNNLIPFSIFPNPTNTIVNIVAKEKFGLFNKIEIYNLEGNLILEKTGKLSNVSIDVSNFPLGTYLVKIHSNSVIYSDKFIKN